MLAKVEGSRKRRRPNLRWMDSIKEAVSMRLQELSRAVGTGRRGHRSLTRLSGVGADSVAHHTPTLAARPHIELRISLLGHLYTFIMLFPQLHFLLLGSKLLDQVLGFSVSLAPRTPPAHERRLTNILNAYMPYCLLKIVSWLPWKRHLSSCVGEQRKGSPGLSHLTWGSKHIGRACLTNGGRKKKRDFQDILLSPLNFK